MLGVDFHKNKYRARCETLDGNKFIGNYNSEKEAFIAYKKFKENYIKTVADQYKNNIPNNVYKAMMSYIVEEND